MNRRVAVSVLIFIVAGVGGCGKAVGVDLTAPSSSMLVSESSSSAGPIGIGQVNADLIGKRLDFRRSAGDGTSSVTLNSIAPNSTSIVDESTDKNDGTAYVVVRVVMDIDGAARNGNYVIRYRKYSHGYRLENLHAEQDISPTQEFSFGS